MDERLVANDEDFLALGADANRHTAKLRLRQQKDVGEGLIEAAADGAFPDEPYDPDADGKRRPPWWVWLIAALALAGIGLGLYFLLKPADTVTVPKVVGLQQAAATTILRNDGFEARVERVTSDSAEGTVLRQDPQPFTKVDEGSAVTLTVSNGPGDGTVPDVQGQPQDEAEKRLKAASFKVRVQSEISDTIAKGDATRTSPPSGSQLTKGSTVSLFISAGKGKTTVPSVIGQTQSAAETSINAAGLQVSVSEQESDQTPGTVLRQSPDGGTSVEKGSTVSIVIAKAPVQVTVPDVVGEDQSAAATQLSGAGFTVIINEQEVSDPRQDGVVHLVRSTLHRSRAPRGGDAIRAHEASQRAGRVRPR